MPIPIVKNEAKDVRSIISVATELAEWCDKAVRYHTGRDNKMRNGHPICVVSLECDFWQLECNDPNLITNFQLEHIVNTLKSRVGEKT